MDVIGRAAPLYRKRGLQAMLFHVTTEDDIGVIDEQGPGEMGAGDSTFVPSQASSNCSSWQRDGR